MSIDSMMADALPLNRKEKYYTGTVFPGIVCADNFKHFNTFARLLPERPSFKIDPDPASTNIQFFTEYSPLDSFVGASKARMREIPASNETPDVAIVLDGQPERILIVLEAKVFDSPSDAELDGQLRKQEPFIRCVKASLNVERVYHAALIPAALAEEFRSFSYAKVTWDDLYAAYSSVIPTNYFLGVLGYAVKSFPLLRSSSHQVRGKNAEEKLSGAEIRGRFQTAHCRIPMLDGSGRQIGFADSTRSGRTFAMESGIASGMR